MRKVCMFCMRSHKVKPKLCDAKGKVLSAYAKSVPIRDFWKVMHGIETGLIDLDGEAHRLLSKNKAASKR